jgi:hypothetical protein
MIDPDIHNEGGNVVVIRLEDLDVDEACDIVWGEIEKGCSEEVYLYVNICKYVYIYVHIYIYISYGGKSKRDVRRRYFDIQIHLHI